MPRRWGRRGKRRRRRRRRCPLPRRTTSMTRSQYPTTARRTGRRVDALERATTISMAATTFSSRRTTHPRRLRPPPHHHHHHHPLSNSARSRRRSSCRNRPFVDRSTCRRASRTDICDARGWVAPRPWSSVVARRVREGGGGGAARTWPAARPGTALGSGSWSWTTATTTTTGAGAGSSGVGAGTESRGGRAWRRRWSCRTRSCWRWCAVGSVDDRAR